MKVEMSVNEGEFERLCIQLNLPRIPTVEVCPYASTRHGDYSVATNHIRLFISEGRAAERLSVAIRAVGGTLIHEARHAWQYQIGNVDLNNVVALENDARAYASANIGKFPNVVRVKRTHPRSGFSKLARVQDRIV